MGEPVEQRVEPSEGWPVPSPDVLRELEPPALAWDEPEWPAGPPPRTPART